MEITQALNYPTESSQAALLCVGKLGLLSASASREKSTNQDSRGPVLSFFCFLFVLLLSTSFPGCRFLSLVRGVDDWKCDMGNLAPGDRRVETRLSPYGTNLKQLLHLVKLFLPYQCPCQASLTQRGLTFLLTAACICHLHIILQSSKASHGWMSVLCSTLPLPRKNSGLGAHVTAVLKSHRLQYRQNLCCCR